MSRLCGRAALVTGAGRGIGRAIALGLAEAGASVALVARTAAELEATADEARSHGVTAVAIVADLADRADVLSAAAQAQEAVGPIDILINNAGVGSSIDPRPVSDYSDATWDITLAINLTAPYLLCKAVLPRMIERKWGRIINISSINARTGAANGAAYAASKAASRFDQLAAARGIQRADSERPWMERRRRDRGNCVAAWNVDGGAVGS